MTNNLTPCDTCGRLALDTETITISQGEYRELISIKARATAVNSISRMRAVSGSKIAFNPEMANFILREYETKTIKAVHAACVEKFGPSTPSRSTIHRFISQMR